MKRLLLFAALTASVLFSENIHAQTVNSAEYSVPQTNDFTKPVLDNDDYMITTAERVSLDAAPVASSLLVYPNPVVSTTRIALDQVPGSNVYVDILDMNGVIERTFEYAPGSYQLDVDMSNMPQGLYSVRVSGRDIGYYNLKVVKE